MWYSEGMTYTLTIGPNGTIIAPPGLLADLALQEGDVILGERTPEGGMHILPRDVQRSDTDRQMAIARRVMAEDRDVLQRLAE